MRFVVRRKSGKSGGQWKDMVGDCAVDRYVCNRNGGGCL
jgi:hypothetical protein